MKKIFALVGMITMFALKATAQAFPVDTLLLNKAYAELMAHPNDYAKQKAFFDAFPSNWNEFNMLYQFAPSDYLYSKYDLAMYEVAHKHIGALKDNMTLINDTMYCRKLVHVSVGGVHEADAPNYLQMVLEKAMAKKTDVMISVISEMRLAYQMLFWQFYWSSIRRIKEQVEEHALLEKKYKDAYPREVKVMTIAYDYFCGGVNIGDAYLK